MDKEKQNAANVPPSVEPMEENVDQDDDVQMSNTVTDEVQDKAPKSQGQVSHDYLSSYHKS